MDSTTKQKEKLSETKIKLRIPKSLLKKWGFDGEDLSVFNGKQINPSKYLRESIEQALKQPKLVLEADIFSKANDEIIEKSIWVPARLKESIMDRCHNCTMNSYLIAALDSLFRSNNEESEIKKRVAILEKKLQALQEELWFLSVENDLNMKSRFDPKKFFE